MSEMYFNSTFQSLEVQLHWSMKMAGDVGMRTTSLQHLSLTTGFGCRWGQKGWQLDQIVIMREHLEGIRQLGRIGGQRPDGQPSARIKLILLMQPRSLWSCFMALSTNQTKTYISWLSQA